MHGAGVGMDEIAATAGTSKTVFYRHFDGRAGLYRAVAEHVDAGLLAQVMGAARLRGAAGAGHRGIAGAAGARKVLREAVDTYLRLVEEDPQVYLFVVSAPLVPAREGGGRDVAADATDAMSGRIVGLLASFLEEAGQPSLRAQRWSRAVVGSVRSAGDDWLRAGASASGTERVELVDDLTTLLWDGLSGSLAQP